MPSDESWMRMALREARKGVGHVSPNPAVGAVLVRKGKLLAKGFHARAGSPHAEIEALRKTPDARGATLYVTLEPCSTQGRTPPCVGAIIEAGVAEVVVGTVDPNPRHCGGGLRALRRAGLIVREGVLEKDCRDLNAAFSKWITTGLPLVIAKAALSWDGRLTAPKAGRWLTGPEARAHAHQLRARVDAILIGAGTLRADNPHLTVRGVPGARQPWRVVVTRNGNLPEAAHIFTDEFRERTLIFRNKSLASVMRELGRREISSVMIEGGGEVLREAFQRELVDRVQFYLAPLLGGKGGLALGGLGHKTSWIDNPQYVELGPDICLTGEVRYWRRTATDGGAEA